MPLRRKLFLVLALMTVVPLSILLFGVVENIEKDLESRIEAELHGTLDKMSGELDTLLGSQKSLAMGLAKVPAVTQFADVATSNSTSSYEARARQLEGFFLNYQAVVPTIQALRFIDTDGKTLVKVKEGLEIAPEQFDNVGQRYFVADQLYKPFFQRAINSDEAVTVSDFELGQVTTDADFCPAMLRYSVRVVDELDTLQGMLVVNMWGTRVDASVEASLGGYPGNVYIVELNQDPERDGIYLYHKETDFRFANQTGADHRLSSQLGDAVWADIKNSAADGQVVTDDGRMLFYNKYSPYENVPSQWLLVIETDRDKVFAPIISLRAYIWVLMLVLVVMSILIARWASARMARPVQQLASIITRYADGDQSVRYSDRRSDEIGVAGKAFNYLCENLENTQRERDKAEKAVQQSERLAAVGQLAAGIGHEINNPLTNIMSLAELLQQSLGEDSDEQVRSDLHTLQEEGRRCARIVQGILNFARSNEPAYRQFDMAELLDDTVTLLRHRLIAGELQLELDVARPLVMEGDPNLLQQVLVNVLLNAIHASPQGNVIRVSAQQEGEQALLDVLDNGSGISDENIQRIFNPFFTTKSEGAGTGLGLSVSYGIINKHGGTISIENRPEGGVKVHIALPLKIGDVEFLAKAELDQPIAETRVAN